MHPRDALSFVTLDWRDPRSGLPAPPTLTPGSGTSVAMTEIGEQRLRFGGRN